MLLVIMGFMQKLRIAIAAVVLVLMASTLAIGMRNDVVVTRYHLGVSGIKTPIRVAVVADTHSCRFEDGQQEIANLVRPQNPDVIVLAGDIVDDVLPMQRGLDTVRQLPQIAPTFYVSGNHEFWSGQADRIKTEIAAMGIHVLAGDVEEIDVDGQRLSVAGLDDLDVGGDFANQVARLQSLPSETPRLLISHRPELTSIYQGLDADVIVSGHAHGGQWRIPIAPGQGIFAPNQGFMPPLTSGIHQLAGGQRLVISRGLSRESTPVPRIFNPPEVVVVDLEAGN